MHSSGILKIIDTHRPQLEPKKETEGQKRLFRISVLLMVIGFLTTIISGIARNLIGIYGGGILFILGYGGYAIFEIWKNWKDLIFLYKPTTKYVERLHRQIEEEEKLILALESFSLEDLELAKTRFEFEIESISLRARFLLGTTSKIAVVPITGLILSVFRFWQAQGFVLTTS